MDGRITSKKRRATKKRCVRAKREFGTTDSSKKRCVRAKREFGTTDSSKKRCVRAKREFGATDSSKKRCVPKREFGTTDSSQKRCVRAKRALISMSQYFLIFVLRAQRAFYQNTIYSNNKMKTREQTIRCVLAPRSGPIILVDYILIIFGKMKQIISPTDIRQCRAVPTSLISSR